MSVAASVGSSVGKAVASSIGVGSGAWSPNALGLNVRERTLEGGLAYESSLLSNLPVMRSLEPYGSYRAPRQGRCWKGDGIDDYGVSSGNIGITGAAPRTICFRAKLASTSGSQSLVAFGGPSGIGHRFNATVFGNNYYFNGENVADFSTGVAADTNWHHHALVYDGTNVSWYVDGSLIASQARALNTAASSLNVLNRSTSNDWPSSAYIHDIRVYNVAKSLAEIQAIYAGDYEDPDRSGLVAGYWCNEESGTLGYDWSGNGRHLTLTNITQATFHAADTGVTRNANNVHGYRLSGSVYIPANLSSPTTAADGNALTATGQSPYPVATESVCLTLASATSEYVSLPSRTWNIGTMNYEFEAWIYVPTPSSDNDILGTAGTSTGDVLLMVFSNKLRGHHWTNSSVNTTDSDTTILANTWYHVKQQVTATELRLYINGVLDKTTTLVGTKTNKGSHEMRLGSRGAGFYSGRIANAKLTNTDTGEVIFHLPLQDGPGSANLNRTCLDASGNGYHGTIVNGTVSTIWANRCPRVKDWCIEHGGRLAGQNLLTYSEQFDNAAWTKSGCSITENSAVAPDGTVTADTLTSNGASSVHRIYRLYSLGSGVWSVFAKADTVTRIQIYSGTYSSAYANFDLSNGTITGQGTDQSATIEAIGNGWYRCVISCTNASFGDPHIGFISSGTSGRFETNTVSGTIFIWGAQLHSGSVLLPYTKTVATAHNDQFILGIPNSSLCADGNAKTLTAGKHGNPYSRLIPNPFTAAELNGRSIPTSLAPGGSLAGVTPSGSAFIRSAANGDDRLLITKEALTGAALAKAQEWVS